jgi:hypothetical protein
VDKILPWLLSAGGGALGGNLVGLLGRLKNLTPLVKTVLGALGGIAGVKGAEAANLLSNMGNAEQAGVGAGAGALLTSLFGGLLVKKPS